MECEQLLKMAELLAILFFLGVSILLSTLVFEAHSRRRRRIRRTRSHLFEDDDLSCFEYPNSMITVRHTSIQYPAEKYISLVIPAFNEEHRLHAALVEIMNYLDERARQDHSFTFEVVIVDDGSVDKTKEVAFNFVRQHSMDKVRIVPLGANHGKGEAIKKGMMHSRGKLLLMLDADGATKIKDMEKLENKIYEVANRDYGDQQLLISDVPIAVFGSRAHLEEKALATRKWYRNLLMKGFHLAVLLSCRSEIRDTQCGFKMFTRAAAKMLFSTIQLTRWCFDVELLFLCRRLGIPVTEIQVSWSEIPGSKVNLLSIPNMLWELGLMSLGYRLGIWKIPRFPKHHHIS